jgi:hypothetical protein
LAVSEAALTGTDSPRTLKIKGVIQHMGILVLIDSGSSHSFISMQVANQLQGVSPSAEITRVQVPNGNNLFCSSEMLNVVWFVQGYIFQSDLKVLELQNFDMILGLEWLEQYSPMKVHWAHKWLTIPCHHTHITLHGILPGVLDCNIIELMQIQTDLQPNNSD